MTNNVDSDGRIRCVICSGMLSLASADIVGLGYRCRPCSLRAQIDGSDDAAHLSPAERLTVSREPSPLAWITGGLALLVTGVVMWTQRWDIPFARTSLLFWVFIIGIGAVGTGWFRWLDR